jgi:hypothetical protein
MATDAVDAFRQIARLIFKWLLIALLVVVGLVAVIAACMAAYTWYYETRHVANIEVNVNVAKDGVCKTDDFPIFVGVINRSERTIEKVTFRLSAKMKDRSTDLTEYHSNSDDRIIKPTQGFGNCWAAPKLREQVPDVRSLNWSIESKSFYFAE